MSIRTYEMKFNGEVLERGFWLYIWEITQQRKKYLYVGRTGDSSSANASSPFNRIGQHLDFRKNAKGNSLAKRLKEVNVDPRKGKFRMLALGPFFQEQKEFEIHKKYRDQMATFEFELAKFLNKNGYLVIGKHHKGTAVQASKMNEVKTKVIEFLKNKNS